MQRYKWLYLDLNSYFASVEQLLNPAYRGQPLIVVPVMADNTSVIAASVEAKRKGIKTGMRVLEARRIWPKIIMCCTGHDKYVDIHHKILAAVENILPIFSVNSIDEMCFELIGKEQLESNAVHLAKQLKRAIQNEVGQNLTSSIGLASNKYLAKIASDLVKPDGLELINEKNRTQIIKSLKLRDYPGIGPKMEARMIRYGIKCSEQLLDLNKQDLKLLWGGIAGERFYDLIRGLEVDDERGDSKSIGHSKVLSPSERNLDQAFVISQRLIHKSLTRLRKNGLVASKLAFNISFIGGEDKSIKKTLIENSDDISFIEAFKEIWDELKLVSFKQPLKVGVTLSKFTEVSAHTPSLFHNQKRSNLSHAKDQIQRKFGKNKAEFASMTLLENDSSNLVAFQYIPDKTV